MKNLVQRLRELSALIYGLGGKIVIDEAADAIEKMEAENAALKAELAAMRDQKPVAYWIPRAEQFCFASPTGRPFAKAWEPLYAAPGAK